MRKIEEIVVNERVEGIIPLVYLTLIVMAYYGPNANLLGNIKLQIWQYESQIGDIEKFITNIILLLFVDFLSFLVNGAFIWNFCKVNVLSVFMKIQKSFWLYFANTEVLLLMLVKKVHNQNKLYHRYRMFSKNKLQEFQNLCISGGNDLTLEFKWIHGNFSTQNVTNT